MNSSGGDKPPLLLVAVGGNALIRAGQRGTADEQFENALATAASLVRLIRDGYRLVVTHGNGPQVGAQLIRSETASRTAYRMPYDCCVAATQGEIGYVLQYALWQTMQQAHLRVPVVSLMTQVLIDKNDPAFLHPTKPVGPYYTAAEAEHLRAELGWTLTEIPARGWRRVVPSPEPRAIVELDAIRACINEGLVVIAAGGGGIPVSNDHDTAKGMEAVIDKDLTSALLARRIGADLFVIATDVERVYLDFGTPRQRPLVHASAEEVRRHLQAGQFPEGSMGPKIHAALRYLDLGGREVVITDTTHVLEGVRGDTGTRIEAFPEFVDWP
jgi:carbamate kinase